MLSVKEFYRQFNNPKAYDFAKKLFTFLENFLKQGKIEIISNSDTAFSMFYLYEVKDRNVGLEILAKMLEPYHWILKITPLDNGGIQFNLEVDPNYNGLD